MPVLGPGDLVAVVLMGVGFVALLIGIVLKVVFMTFRTRGDAGPARVDGHE